MSELAVFSSIAPAIRAMGLLYWIVAFGVFVAALVIPRRFWIKLLFGLVAAAIFCGLRFGAAMQAQRTTKVSGDDCRDRICVSDAVPKNDDPVNDAILKIGGRWYVGPREYFSSVDSAASFDLWNHKPLRPSEKRPSEAQALAVGGRGDEFAVEIFLHSYTGPAQPAFDFIKLAERNGWILHREMLRPGLEKIRMRHVIGPSGSAIDQSTYFVATELREPSGQPPVAICNLDNPKNSGGTGFFWKSDIWVETRWNQRLCADFPEIFSEATRVLSLLKEVDK